MAIRSDVLLGKTTMLTATESERIPLDPRTMIILLLFINIVAFSDRPIYLEVATIGLLLILAIYTRCTRAGVTLVGIFIVIAFFQYYVFPHSMPVFVTLFTIMSFYIRKLIPCLILGSIIVKRIPMSYLLLAFRKWHVPERIIVILAVTIRYFPAIREESIHIKDAMKLRGIKGFAKVEAYIVPLMVAAVNTAEELSAAAVTRGIENPIKKTSSFDIRFGMKDYILLGVGAILAVSTVWM